MTFSSPPPCHRFSKERKILCLGAVHLLRNAFRGGSEILWQFKQRKFFFMNNLWERGGVWKVVFFALRNKWTAPWTSTNSSTNPPSKGWRNLRTTSYMFCRKSKNLIKSCLGVFFQHFWGLHGLLLHPRIS